MSEQFYQQKRDRMLQSGLPVRIEALSRMDQPSKNYIIERAFDELCENLTIEASHMQAGLGISDEQFIKDYVALIWLNVQSFTAEIRGRVANRVRIESDFFKVYDFVPFRGVSYYLDSDEIRKDFGFENP